MLLKKAKNHPGLVAIYVLSCEALLYRNLATP